MQTRAASQIINATFNKISFCGIVFSTFYRYTLFADVVAYVEVIAVCGVVALVTFITDYIANLYADHDRIAIALSFFQIYYISLFELTPPPPPPSTLMFLLDVTQLIGSRATCNASCHLCASSIV